MQETQEMWVRYPGQEDPLEEERKTHSSVPACKILWTEEPGRLQSTGLHRVGHVTEHTCIHAYGKGSKFEIMVKFEAFH